MVRRFPPPWSVEDIGAAFVVRDQNGHGLAYVYLRGGPEKERAADLAALKLVRTLRVEEHVWGSRSLMSIKIAARLPREQEATAGRYCFSIIWDNSATVGSLPFGVKLLTITGIPCDSCLVSSSSETPVI
jgi:hypothetical protein